MIFGSTVVPAAVHYTGRLLRSLLQVSSGKWRIALDFLLTVSGSPSSTITTSPTVLLTVPPTVLPTTITVNSPLTTNSTTVGTSTQTAPSSSSHISGAALAGAVVGPICGVALLLGLGFLIRRERRRKPPAADISSNPQPPSPGPTAPFGGYAAGRSDLGEVNAPNTLRPMSITPAYPGAENVGTTVAMKGMPSQTMWDGSEVGTHSQIRIGQQRGPQVYQQMQSQQVPARRPVMAQLGTNPRITGMPPEWPTNR